jgi:hypothetical protein
MEKRQEEIQQTKNIKTLLFSVRKIVKHHNNLTIAKGEHFNLFSVLDIETKENKTHSAFLAELLNPNGTHKKGNVFLKHFLTVILHEDNLKSRNFNANLLDTEKTTVTIEKYIQEVKLYKDDNEKHKSSGGRIDIYLRDTNGNIISIENKIHAKDQEAQIQRYYNHKKNKNIVYYLTLMGTEPDEDSKLELKSNKDYFNISYKTDIVKWLQLCLKEVPNFTSLREAINQYILLIKKLTNTLDMEAQEELFDTMADYLNESKIIADNYNALVDNIRDKFRTDLKKALEKELIISKYDVVYGNSVNKYYSQLWIDFKGKVNHQFRYGIESFSGRGFNNGRMFIGIFGEEPLMDFEEYPNKERLHKGWQHIHQLLTKEDNPINLNSSVLLQRIKDEKEIKKYNSLLENTVKQIVIFIKNTEKELGFIL